MYYCGEAATRDFHKVKVQSSAIIVVPIVPFDLLEGQHGANTLTTLFEYASYYVKLLTLGSAKFERV